MNPLPIIDIGLKLIDKFFPDKTEADKQKLNLLQMQQNGEFKEWDVLATSDTNQTSINVEEAKSDSFFKSGWRPAVGWICVGGLSYQMMIRPLFTWVATNLWQWTPMPSLEMESLFTLLFGMLGLGAYRTYEKKYKVN